MKKKLQNVGAYEPKKCWVGETQKICYDTRTEITGIYLLRRESRIWYSNCPFFVDKYFSFLYFAILIKTDKYNLILTAWIKISNCYFWKR